MWIDLVTRWRYPALNQVKASTFYPHNFCVIRFLNGVSDKKSSWTLIYSNKEHSINTQIRSLIKTKCNNDIRSLGSFNCGKKINLKRLGMCLLNESRKFSWEFLGLIPNFCSNWRVNTLTFSKIPTACVLCWHFFSSGFSFCRRTRRSPSTRCQRYRTFFSTTLTLPKYFLRWSYILQLRLETTRCCSLWISS